MTGQHSLSGQSLDLCPHEEHSKGWALAKKARVASKERQHFLGEPGGQPPRPTGEDAALMPQPCASYTGWPLPALWVWALAGWDPPPKRVLRLIF